MCQLVGACLNEPSWTDGKCRKEKRSLEEKDGLLTLIKRAQLALTRLLHARERVFILQTAPKIKVLH
jgi:hypothetical protein